MDELQKDTADTLLRAIMGKAATSQNVPVLESLARSYALVMGATKPS